ncbi:MAG: TPM domain-containing protein [Luteolibacter sp.]
MTGDRDYSPKRFAISGVHCPRCAEKLDREAKWCPKCDFTGAKSLDMFGDNPPPLLPILDVTDLWNKKEEKQIKSAVASFQKRFPQIRWRVCSVALGPEVHLPVFGFWLMNVCPLMPEETAEDREWTVLLLVEANSGRASVTTGYSAEVWLSDEMWEKALAEMGEPFRRGHPDQAVVNFMKTARELMEKAWKRSQKQLANQKDRP